MELEDRFEELEAQGLGAAAISYDSQDVLAAFAERKGIRTVPLLSDDDSAVIRAFGIYNTVAEEAVGSRAGDPDVKTDVAQYVSVFGASPRIVGTPYPGTFIVDREGRVTARFFEEFYRERNTAANIMLKLGTPVSPIAGTRGSTSHLSLNAYQSDPAVTAGTRFHLGLEVTPVPGMHVYAPGADDLGYRVIRLDLDARDYFRFLPLEYPSSEIYHFEPLDERVPVYMRPFTLVQEVVVEASAEATEALASVDALTLTGTLDYQACDDRVCFEPASVPLAWTLTVEPLDRQRTDQPGR